MIGSARSNSKTLTEAAQQEIRQAIIKGTYRPGSQLPAETELVEMLGVSRTVVREALRTLEEDGLITRRRGVGTFVRKRPILNNLSFNFGTTDMIKSAGMTSGTQQLNIQLSQADGEVADALNLPSGAAIVTIERVRTADGKPVVYSLDTIPQSLIGNADLVSIWRNEDRSLYQILQIRFGQVVAYGVARILPVAAPAPVADKLRVPKDSLLLCLLQTDYSPLDEPMLYSREYHLPDAFDFMILRKGPIRIEGSPASPVAE
jgi:GntR family transcriptional regulator